MVSRLRYLTVVHIAGAPTEDQQRCVRCHKVLIDATGAQSMDGLGMHWWPVGGYIGMIEPGASVLMDHDARAEDEINCKEATIQ